MGEGEGQADKGKSNLPKLLVVVIAIALAGLGGYQFVLKDGGENPEKEIIDYGGIRTDKEGNVIDYDLSIFSDELRPLLEMDSEGYIVLPEEIPKKENQKWDISDQYYKIDYANEFDLIVAYAVAVRDTDVELLDSLDENDDIKEKFSYKTHLKNVKELTAIDSKIKIASIIPNTDRSKYIFISSEKSGTYNVGFYLFLDETFNRYDISIM